MDWLGPAVGSIVERCGSGCPDIDSRGPDLDWITLALARFRTYAYRTGSMWFRIECGLDCTHQRCIQIGPI